MQYILTYCGGFIMALCFPFYFYKAYDIYQLKWHATRGVLLLIHLPCFLLFSITYLITSGFISAKIHKNEESTILINYATWESAGKFRKFIAFASFSETSKKIQAFNSKTDKVFEVPL